MKQLECRIVIIHVPIGQFKLGMVDPKTDRYEELGIHPRKDVDRIVTNLKSTMQRAGHMVTVSEKWE